MIWPAAISARNNMAAASVQQHGLRLDAALKLFIQTFDGVRGADQFPSCAARAFRDGAVGSHDRRLDVAERGVDPFESRRFGGLRSRAGDDRRMRAAGLVDGSEAFQAVGDDLGAALESAVLASLRSATLLNAFTRRRMI